MRQGRAYRRSLVLLLCVAATACGGRSSSNSGGNSGNFTISPATATVVVADNLQQNAGTQTFTATGASSVNWSICALAGSPCYGPGTWNQYGSITSAGVFTGPVVLPNPPQVLIKAADANNNSRFATATVNIDRNVHWTVTTAPSSGSPPVNWSNLAVGDNTVYYHIFHNGTEEQCMMTAGGPLTNCYRQVVIHVGTGYSSGNGAILYFHGSTGGVSQCETMAGLKTEVDHHGWIVFCPQGEYNSVNSTATNWVGYWAAQGGQVVPQPSAPDDSAFAWAMAWDAVNNLAVGAKRVYVTGYSAGVMLLSRLAADDGALIAGVAQVTGNTYGTDHSMCDGSSGNPPCNPPSNYPQGHSFPPYNLPLPNLNYPVSVLIMMGTSDGAAPDCGFSNNVPSIGEDVNFYVTNFHCGTISPDSNPMCPYVAGQSATCQQSNFVTGEGRVCTRSTETYKDADGCDSGVVVRAYRLYNAQHQWYPTQDICGTSGVYNHQLATDFPAACPVADGGSGGSGYENDVVWTFFNQHPKP